MSWCRRGAVRSLGRRIARHPAVPHAEKKIPYRKQSSHAAHCPTQPQLGRPPQRRWKARRRTQSACAGAWPTCDWRPRRVAAGACEPYRRAAAPARECCKGVATVHAPPPVALRNTQPKPPPWGFFVAWCWGCIWAKCLQVAYKDHKKRSLLDFA